MVFEKAMPVREASSRVNRGFFSLQAAMVRSRSSSTGGLLGNFMRKQEAFKKKKYPCSAPGASSGAEQG
jgi:hypothetical protein